MLAGKGSRTVIVMWVMTGLAFIFVPLRLYTRIRVLKALGSDDHVFNLAWVSLKTVSHLVGGLLIKPSQLCLFLYTLFLTIAGVHGFGQPITTLTMDEAVKAVYTEMIGQTFAVLGMAIAKVSLGIFLLRIVVVKWHRVSIWISIVSLSIVSVMTATIFWTQRIPSTSIYDPRVPGRTVVRVTPFSILLGCTSPLISFENGTYLLCS
jgi:hypothetical protein